MKKIKNKEPDLFEEIYDVKHMIQREGNSSDDYAYKQIVLEALAVLFLRLKYLSRFLFLTIGIIIGLLLRLLG